MYAASSASGANVQVYDDNDTAAQRWIITKNSNGTYTLRSKAGQCVLDVYSANLVSGSNIWMYTSNGTAAQQFCIDIKKVYEAGLVDLGSDSYYNRIATYALLQRKSDGEKLLVINTHLDHSNDTVRARQFEVIRNFINSYGVDCPVLLTGDFNTLPGLSVYNAVLSVGFADSSVTADNSFTGATYTDFGKKSQILDYVFTTPEIDAEIYKVCNEKFSGAYPSDHNAIYFRYSF